MDVVGVTACLVTRGDVDLQPIIDSLPNDWQIVIWDNGDRMVTRSDGFTEVCHDLSVFGRYAAIEYATNDLIYVADDDVIVSDPQEIVEVWNQQNKLFYEQQYSEWWYAVENGEHDRQEVFDTWPGIVCNHPQEFRHDFYSDHSLVGFGAAFYRDAPKRAFARFKEHSIRERGGLCRTIDEEAIDGARFNRCCDIVFTVLTPCVRVDVPKENLPHAYADDRMWRQPTHQAERQRMLDLVRRVRDEK